MHNLWAHFFFLAVFPKLFLWWWDIPRISYKGWCGVQHTMQRKHHANMWRSVENGNIQGLLRLFEAYIDTFILWCSRNVLSIKSWERLYANDIMKSLNLTWNGIMWTFFVALFVLSLCPIDISVGVGAFVIGLGQIFSFLSSYIYNKTFQIWHANPVDFFPSARKNIMNRYNAWVWDNWYFLCTLYTLEKGVFQILTRCRRKQCFVVFIEWNGTWKPVCFGLLSSICDIAVMDLQKLIESRRCYVFKRNKNGAVLTGQNTPAATNSNSPSNASETILPNSARPSTDRRKDAQGDSNIPP